MAANAQVVVVDDIKYSILSQKATVIDIVSPKAIVEIPDSITFEDAVYPVVSITGLSSNGKSIESLTIPASVTKLSGTADLTALKELNIKDSDTELWITNIYSYTGDSDTAEGRHAFYNSPLKKLYLGRNLSYYSDNSNGYSPFAKNSFDLVTVGSEVTTLTRNLFWNCDFESFSLEQAVSLRVIGDDALSKTNLEELILPESVEYVSSDFRFNQKLKHLYLGKNLSSIDYRFEHFYSLESITVNPENPNFTSVGGTLYTADKQTLLRVAPASAICETTPAKNIGDGAFYDMSRSTLIVPQGVEILGKNLINNCSALTSIVIPESVKEISDNAFSAKHLNNAYESWYFDGDSKIYSADNGTVMVLAKEPPTVGKDVFEGREDWTLWVPLSWYNKYVDSDGIYAKGWDVFKKYKYGAQLIYAKPNIAEAGTVSTDKKFYSPYESMSLSLDSLSRYYNFVGWYERGTLISSERQAVHKVVSLQPIEGRFEPIPDAASEFVSVYVIDGHLIVDVNLRADNGTYETTVYDAAGNELGKVRTQILKADTVSDDDSGNTHYLSNVDNYSLIVYDNNNNKVAHYVGKVKDNMNDYLLPVEDINSSSPTIYYNLQGQQVSHPHKGEIYIVNENGKYRKHLF